MKSATQTKFAKAASRLGLVAALGAVALTAAPASAHHSFSIFDFTKPVNIDGTVTKFDFINPHGWVTVASTEKGAPVVWKFEVANPNALVRLGWKKDTLKPGDKVVVKAVRSRDGSNTGLGQSFVLADGRTVLGGNPVR